MPWTVGTNVRNVRTVVLDRLSRTPLPGARVLSAQLRDAKGAVVAYDRDGITTGGVAFHPVRTTADTDAGVLIDLDGSRHDDLGADLGELRPALLPPRGERGEHGAVPLQLVVGIPIRVER